MKNKWFFYKNVFNFVAMTLVLFCNLANGSSEVYQSNLARTGVYEEGGPRSTPELSWDFFSKSAIFSTPLIYDDFIYFVNFEGEVYSLNLNNGDMEWKLELGGRPSFQIALNEDVLLVGYHYNQGDGGRIIAFDRLSGDEVWSFYSPDESGMNSPAIYEGQVYVTSANNIHSLDLSSGEELWSLPISGGSRAFLFDNATMYYQDDSQKLYSVSPASGSVNWIKDFSDSVDSLFSTPAIQGCCIYALVRDSHGLNLSSIDKVSGEKSNLFFFESSSMSSLSVDGGIVFFGDDGVDGDGHMNAVDLHSGELLWQFKTKGIVGGAPSISGDTIYFGSYDNFLYALDKSTGELKWEYETEGEVASSPSVFNGRIYFGNIAGYIKVLQ